MTESAVMASEIEALPDRAGYLKFASEPVSMKVEFPVYDLPTGAKSFAAGQGLSQRRPSGDAQRPCQQKYDAAIPRIPCMVLLELQHIQLAP